MAPRDWLHQFVQDGTISKDQLKEAQEAAASLGISVEDALVKLEYVEPARINEAKARAFGFKSVNLDGMEIPHSVIEMVPESVARENLVIPVSFDNDRLEVAVVDPFNYEVVEKLRFILDRDVEMLMGQKDQILSAINRHYGQSQTESVDSMLLEFTETAIDFTEAELSRAETEAAEDENSPVIRLVNLIIQEAVNMRASDIHVEPFEDRVRTRHQNVVCDHSIPFFSLLPIRPEGTRPAAHLSALIAA